MADMNFSFYDYGEGQDYGVTLGDNSDIVSGNKALANRFQITLFNNGISFIGSDGEVVSEGFGGRFFDIITQPRVLSDENAMRATLVIVVNNTVNSIRNDDSKLSIPDTEKLDSATLVDMTKSGDIISARIKITPVEKDSFGDLFFDIPIIEV